MMKRYLYVLLILFVVTTARAQHEQTDSLIGALKFAKEDTNKVHLFWAIGKTIIFQKSLAAIPYYRKGLALAQKLNFSHGIEKCYNAISLAFSYNAQYDSALVYINYAIPYAHKAGIVRRLALAYINRADVYVNLERHNLALRDCDTALSYTKKEPTNFKGQARIHGIMSDIYESQKKYADALVESRRSLEFFQQAGEMQMVAMMYSDEADIYTQMDNPDKAIPLYLIAIRIGDSLNDIENVSAYNIGLAQSYLRKEQFTEAERRAFVAYDYARQTENVMQQAVIYQVLGIIYSKQERHQLAVEFLLKSYEVTKTEGDLIRQYTSALGLSEEYSKLGDNAKAYEFLKISNELNDTLQKQRFSSEIAKMQTAFQVEQKDKEILLLKKNKELQQDRLTQQRMLTGGVVLIALLTLTGIWLATNRYRLRQRMKELELRSKIAADLHDDVGSTLSSIRMYSDIVKQQPNQTATSSELLSKISSNSKEMIENMSDIVWMIKPGNDEFINIENRMLNFANNICTPAEINFDFTKNDGVADIKIPMEQRRDIYLIFKEAINNAVKYSSCGSIRTSITADKHHLNINISDDGDGFDIVQVIRGNGLLNMERRATAHGGTCIIQSTPGEGTEVIASFPI